jgi:hypothetical protein
MNYSYDLHSWSKHYREEACRRRKDATSRIGRKHTAGQVQRSRCVGPLGWASSPLVLGPF